MPNDTSEKKTCRDCGRQILWLKSNKGKWVPCEPDMISAGDAEVDEWLLGEDSRWIKVKKDHDPDVYGYVPHFKSCSRGK